MSLSRQSRSEKLPARAGTTVVRVAFFLYKQVVSPLLHALGGTREACRFQPTCSEYATVAIETHGAVRGTLLALRRIAKCHPFHPAEFDPVPGTWPAQAALPAAAVQSSSRPITIEE